MKPKFPTILTAIVIMLFLFVENIHCADTKIVLKDLVGIWKPDTTNDMLISYIKFDDDGTYRIAYNVEKLETRPIDKGQIKIEGSDIIFIPVESPACKTAIGTYTVNKIKKGIFEFTVQEDLCDRRRCLFGRQLILTNP